MIETINVVDEQQKKLNETEIVVVLDRSGSMTSIQDSTVLGFNTFIHEQKNSEGEAFVTLVQFDDRYELNYKSVPVKDVKHLIVGETFIPRGYTALLDAIGKTIDELQTDRDVVFVIITDGDENQSRTYKAEAIKKMIETHETEKGWKFVFMGANQDAITTANTFGISGNNALTYSADNEHVTAAYASVGSNIANFRSAKSVLYSQTLSRGFAASSVEMDSLSDKLSFSAEQRDETI